MELNTTNSMGSRASATGAAALKPANGARPHPKTGDAKVLINTSGKVVNGTAGKAVHKVFTVPASTRAPAAVLGEARPLPVMQQPPQPAQAQAAVTPAVASAAAARPAVAPAAASAAQLPSLQDVCAAMVQPAPARAAAGASTTPAAANGTAPSALSAVAATASSCAASVLGWAGERAHRVVHAYARAVYFTAGAAVGVAQGVAAQLPARFRPAVLCSRK